MKTLIMIPAYNEAESIGPLVQEIRETCPSYDYLIINDGSSDRTAELCRENHFRVLNLPVNTGLSGAIRAGMRYAYLHHYDYAVQIDGDGQHDPSYIDAMMKESKERNLDIVIGSRFKEKRKPLTPRMIGSQLITIAIWITTGGHYIGDVTSGMRLFNRKVIERFAKGFDYRPEPDTLAYLINHGVEIGEVQVEMHDRVTGESYLTAPTTVKYMLHVFFNIFLYQWVRKE